MSDLLENNVLCVCSVYFNRIEMSNVSIGGGTGGSCCSGFVSGFAGEKQLEGNGLEMGPCWVRDANVVSSFYLSLIPRLFSEYITSQMLQ